MGKKWVCLLKSVGKVESNEVFCGAVEEEEGGEKLVEKKKKTNHVMVVLYLTWKIGGLEEDFNVMDQPDDLTLVRPSRSGAMTAISTARRSLYSAPIAVQRADRCDDRCNESIGRYDRYSPTVTQGVVAGLRPN
ncbi:hypothetical protein L249_5987 [Ophiocordyceps polyrhachis-furcata BCC 54312]|uniref:Uncharacterized protein n=1 Tax=Ophiocordyceps polyrhachis-furcata BCC 54312 TaxID=1330021 RepID=A0A367LIZ1_9HYPO|nr:hypothetical protein L249_5987 [Ophiocordyceps polyrhachis-furcata BCC 54312]